jgi:hypothetical protein
VPQVIEDAALALEQQPLVILLYFPQALTGLPPGSRSREQALEPERKMLQVFEAGMILGKSHLSFDDPIFSMPKC